MNERAEIYRRLQRHLDRQAIGFPATESGVELRLLERCFDPTQAEVALLLRYRYETVDAIGERAGDRDIAKEDLTTALNRMARDGLIGKRERGGVQSFRSWPLSIGFWEGQLGRLTPELLADFREYSGNLTFGAAFLKSALPQMRTIPVEASVEGTSDLAPYDRLESLVELAEGPITVTECICRKARELEGDRCGVASGLETCISFGDTARFCLEAGTGRQIDTAETLAILRRNQQEGLVLQPSNSERCEFICSCCGCCCGILEIARHYARPAEIWATNHHAELELDACEGCGNCVDTCQVLAIKWIETNETPALLDGRCIGCGQCAGSCPAGALRLERNAELVAPPADTDQLYERIMADRRRR